MLAFAMWTACAMRSQSTTGESGSTGPVFLSRDTTDTRAVSFPFWMVWEIALDLKEKSRLEIQEELLELEIKTYKSLVQGLEEESRNMELQLKLMQKNQHLLLTQMKAENTRKPLQDVKWVIRMIAALGTGFILGSLNR